MPRVTLYQESPIVLVEDDANDAYFVRHAFEQARIVNPLLHFETVRLARNHLKDLSGSAVPALFLTDLHLAGGENGMDFLRWLREQRQPLGATPTIVLTGSKRPGQQEEAASFGSAALLHKPVTKETLQAAVRSLGFVISTPAASAPGLIIERPA